MRKIYNMEIYRDAVRHWRLSMVVGEQTCQALALFLWAVEMMLMPCVHRC